MGLDDAHDNEGGVVLGTPSEEERSADREDSVSEESEDESIEEIPLKKRQKTKTSETGRKSVQ